MSVSHHFQTSLQSSGGAANGVDEESLLPRTNMIPEVDRGHQAPIIDIRGFLDRLIHGPKDRRNAPRMDSARRKALILSYAPDWIVTAVLFGLFSLITNASGFKREFSVTDITIQHTYAVKERVPFWLAGVYAGAIPAALIILIGTIWERSFYDVHSGLLGFGLSLALATTLTDIVKISVGRPRPDLIDRCQLIPGTVDAAHYGLTTVASCTQTDQYIIDDGFKSFFSGHSSFSFSGLGFLAFYLAGKLHLFDRKGHAIKAWIIGFPLVGATMIAISRVMDYRHHWQDVLVGSAVGLLISWFTYRLYYPSLSHPQCQKPYSPRIPAAKRNILPSSQHDAALMAEEDAPAGTVQRPGERGGHGQMSNLELEDEQ